MMKEIYIFINLERTMRKIRSIATLRNIHTYVFF